VFQEETEEEISISLEPEVAKGLVEVIAVVTKEKDSSVKLVLTISVFKRQRVELQVVCTYR
jgi:hypothetical protein